MRSSFRACLLSLLAVAAFPPPGASAGADVAFIVAQVNGEVITEGDIQKRIADAVRLAQSKYRGAELENQVRLLRQEALDQLIADKLLGQEAMRKPDKDKEKAKDREKEVERRLEEHIKALSEKAGSYAKLVDEVTKAGFKIEEQKEEWRRKLMVEQLVTDHVEKKISVSPAEVRAYYDEHLGEFRREKEVKFRQILIQPDSTHPEDRERARRLAESLLEKLKQRADFAKLAQSYSAKGAHAENGGLWDFTRKGVMIKEVDEVLFRLKAGETSGVVESSLGFHILRAEEITEAHTVGFEDAQEEITRKISGQQYKKFMSEYVEKLKGKALVEIKAK
ncbi:MAG: hypothetical protein FJ278_16015 [Planctomycetes bacterium]|nr:hypothetical protein [Planctomycetota bacterium]